jgi:hypothetical protein
VREALEQLRQANDMLALYLPTRMSLANALVIAGQPEAAGPVYDAAAQLTPDARIAARISVIKAIAMGDFGILHDSKLSMDPAMRAALLGGYRAVESDNAGAKAQAARALVALRPEQRNAAVVWLLADLGATGDAFEIAGRSTTRGNANPSIFWHPSMRGVLRDPGFPAVAEQLGLMNYWKTTKTRPDACNEPSPAPFCGMI